MQLVWLRNDLRLTDNRAILAALTGTDEPIMLAFHVNADQIEPQTPSHDYFFQTVARFRDVIGEQGCALHILYGDAVSEFTALFDAFPAITRVHVNRCERGYGAQRDAAVQRLCAERQIAFTSYLDHHLLGAHDVVKKDGTPFKVFTPYYRAWQKLPKAEPQAVDLAALQAQVVNETAADFFAERQAKFAQLVAGCAAYSDLDAAAARKVCQRFINEALTAYDEQRDFPAINGTSGLSKYLATGVLSIREVLYRVQQLPENAGQATFIQELCWRDFYNMIYVMNPDQQTTAIQEKFRQIPWSNNREWFQAWCDGQTGYPIVDAAMRQLKQTGWMHNRLRMIVASFLTKDLLIDWQWGERYFAKYLIDYDSASNIGGWQWAASTGTDAAPYFRIFNPTTQGQRFDSEGAFIARYVPELAPLPKKLRHEPHKITISERRDYNFVIGRDYPEPIVDHKAMRAEALAVFGAC